MAAQKCKKYMVAGSTEGFLIPCYPKFFFKNEVYQKSCGPYWTKYKNTGSQGVTFVLNELKHFSTEN